MSARASAYRIVAFYLALTWIVVKGLSIGGYTTAVAYRPVQVALSVAIPWDVSFVRLIPGAGFNVLWSFVTAILLTGLFRPQRLFGLLVLPLAIGGTLGLSVLLVLCAGGPPDSWDTAMQIARDGALVYWGAALLGSMVGRTINRVRTRFAPGG